MLKNTKGSSMVSVMVAFIILLMGIAMLFGVVQTSRKLVDKAEENMAKIDSAVNKYYKEALNVKPPGEALGEVQLVDEKSTGFYITIGAETQNEPGTYWYSYFTHKKNTGTTGSE